MKKHLKKHQGKIVGVVALALVGFATFSSLPHRKESVQEQESVKKSIQIHINSVSPEQGPDGTTITLTGSGFSTDSQNIVDFLKVEGKNAGLGAYSRDGGTTIQFTLDLNGTKDAKECVRKLSSKGSCKVGLKVMDASSKKESNEIHFLVTPTPVPPPTTYSYEYQTPVHTATCSLFASIASNTSPAQNIKRGQTGVLLVKFNATANCDATLTGITLSSFAVSLLPMPNGYQNVSTLRLYNDADGSLLGSVPASEPGLNFTGLNKVILTGQTVTLNVMADISPTATLGSTVYGAFGGSSGVDNTNYPVGNNAGGTIIPGNTMTIGN